MPRGIYQRSPQQKERLIALGKSRVTAEFTPEHKQNLAKARQGKKPNWKGGLTEIEKVCPVCLNVFKGVKKRIYCSKGCMFLSKSRSLKIVEARKSTGTFFSNDADRFTGRKYSEYKGSAKRRRIGFALTKEQFEKIFFGRCYYCDNEYALGIDRKDSLKDYSKSNSVPCCTKCNIAKHTMSISEFKDHITLIYLNFNKK